MEKELRKIINSQIETLNKINNIPNKEIILDKSINSIRIDILDKESTSQTHVYYSNNLEDISNFLNGLIAYHSKYLIYKGLNNK